jgi:hypothetical protein
MRVLWSLAVGCCLFTAASLSWAIAEDPAKDVQASPQPEAKPSLPPRDPIPVSTAIDRELNTRLTQEKIPASPLASDAEFLRRVSLDITGRIPTAEQAATFLDSKDSQKRRKLIDELLASPNYGQHFGTIWNDLIVKRDANNRAMNTSPFKKWLADSFNENRGWDKVVRDMLVSEGTVEQSAPTTFYVAHRDMNNLAQSKVVGTTANLFMGLQLQCAECHNHAFIREWKQTDFWGVAAFFSQTRSSGGQMGGQNSAVAISEGAAASAGGRPGFGGRGRPTLAGAQIEIPDATDPRRRTGKIVKAKFFLADEPTLGEKGPYRPVFADWLVSAQNKYFAPAAMNRLWAHFFARGFVNPLDDMHDDNPASHPELLKVLADEFRASGFDQKHLIRVICNSQAYQRTSKTVKENEQDTQLFSHQAIKIMHPEVLYDSLCTALGTSELRTTSGGGPVGFGGAGRGTVATPRTSFVNFFSTKEDGDDPTEMSFGVPQYLRLMNSKPFNEGGAVIEKLLKEEASTDKVIETLFLATLSRRPTETEAKKFAAYVARKEEPKDGYIGALWVLVNSAEFVCVR